MTRPQFDTLLNGICAARGLNQEDVLEALGNFLTENYTTETEQKRREAINEIKRKIVTTIYGMANHSWVTNRPNPKETFGLDNYEMTLLETASNELEAAGHLEGGAHYTSLTPTGVQYARGL